VKAPCSVCDWVHSAADVRAIGRFDPDGPAGYIADLPGAKVRSTRVEAQRDVCTAKATR